MKKGSVQLQESILVTFFVMVIIIMGMVVFYRLSLSSLHNYEDEYREQQLLSLLITLPNDLGYTSLGDSKNSVDTSKLFDEDLDYGFKRIVIEQVYPQPIINICTPQNYPNCNEFIVYAPIQNPRAKNTLVESRPVSLYYPLADEYRAGKLTIEFYY
jgi:hypothetical protein